MTDAIYIPITLQLCRVKEEPRYKVKNVNTQQMFRRPLSSYTESFIFPNLDVYRIQGKKGKKLIIILNLAQFWSPQIVSQTTAHWFQ